jgi:hypothetical protein
LAPMMKGLDATQLRSLPPADANYRVVYEVEDSATAALRQELSGLKLKALKSRARELGVSEEALEDAEDEDDVYAAIVVLCIEATTLDEDTGTGEAALQAELAPLKLKALKERARAVGVSDDALADADDADDVKRSVMDLIMVMNLEAVTQGSAAATATSVYTPADYSAATAVRKKLKDMRLKDLRKKAKDLGVDEDTLEDALDADDSKAAVIALIIDASEAADRDVKQCPQKELLLELQGLRLKELRKRARDAGVDADSLEDTTDSDDPKAAVIELLMVRYKPLAADDRKAAHRAELEGLRLKELRKRAKAAGIDADDLEDTIESDDPKAAVIQLLLVHGESSPEQADNRPHFGTTEQQADRSHVRAVIANGKHAMLSYQWYVS